MRSKILVVDDHPAIRRILETILVEAGYDCVSVESGELAIEVAQTLKFDLVILDINMPRMSGLEVLSRIRQWVPAVLMVTADHDINTVKAAVRLGCDGYVAKPIVPATLLGRVKRVLERPVVFV